MKWKIEIAGGDYNGANRYYNNEGTAVAQAKNYVRRCYKLKYCDIYGTYVEIYYIDYDYKKHLVKTIDIYSL